MAHNPPPAASIDSRSVEYESNAKTAHKAEPKITNDKPKASSIKLIRCLSILLRAANSASMVSTIVFYFINAPLLRLMMESDPLSPERIAQRRAAVLDFISAALFRDRSSNFAGARS